MERLILGIETSCDETACALVARDGRLRGEAVASQVASHARFGGIVPEVAARMHIEACLPLVEATLRDAGADWSAVEAVAVTQGPGLIGCLLVGVETAKALAWLHDRPLIAVNHLAGHLYAPFVTPRRGTHLLAADGQTRPVLPLPPEAGEGADAGETCVLQPEYPHVGLIVSGGHTSLVRVEAPDRMTVLAETIDDAAGEAYDKVARAAGLGFPGGPVIDRLAAEGNADAVALTVPLRRRDRDEFSFSGLKTAAGRWIEQLRIDHGSRVPDAALRDWCAGFQRAVIESLLGKTLRAAHRHGVRDVLFVGGVACNRGLRRAAVESTRSRAHRGLRIWFPHPSLCTDNAAMIAGLAWRLAPLPREAAWALNADAGLELTAVAQG